MKVEDLSLPIMATDVDDSESDLYELEELTDAGHGIELQIHAAGSEIRKQAYEAGIVDARIMNAEDVKQQVALGNWLQIMFKSYGLAQEGLTPADPLEMMNSLLLQIEFKAAKGRADANSKGYKAGSADALAAANARFEVERTNFVAEMKLARNESFAEGFKRTQEMMPIGELLNVIFDQCRKYNTEVHDNWVDTFKELIAHLESDVAAVDRTIEDEMHRGYDDGARAVFTAFGKLWAQKFDPSRHIHPPTV
jgi:hypothetical protein